MLAGLPPDEQPDFGSGSIAERHRRAAIGLHGWSVVYSDVPANFSATSAAVPRTMTGVLVIDANLDLAHLASIHNGTNE
jgi:ParB-like chromosome segregation protein Spo0J